MLSQKDGDHEQMYNSHCFLERDAAHTPDSFAKASLQGASLTKHIFLVLESASLSSIIKLYKIRLDNNLH